MGLENGWRGTQGKSVRALYGFSRAKPLLLAAMVFSLSAFNSPDRSFASPTKLPVKGKPETVPASLLRWPEQGSEYAVLVDKSLQKVFLYKRDNLSTPFKAYPCSTGENEGKKSRQNDKRTPEGIYFFTDVYEGKDLAPIYGVRAFPIDYPNPIDKREGRDGYGIWFHGINKPLKPRDSNGCVALENQNIEDLSSYIKLYDTPIIISSKIEMVDSEKQQKEKEELEKVVESWRKAWEGKQVEKYMSFYSPQFTSGSKDWKQWKEYKTRLAKQYRDIKVEINNLALLRNEGVVMASFHQRYRTSGFDSQGVKKLFLQQNSNQWRIMGEFFEAPEERPKVVLATKRTPPGSNEIKGFIDQWKRAWEQKDLRTYISCYDPGFNSRGMDLKAWKKHREDLNLQHQSVEVAIRDLKIKESSNQTATVSFIQDYRADAYRDTGLKNILLTKKGHNWKIKREDWRPLKKSARQ
jgi:murein L,D-transpeptidase YafK